MNTELVQQFKETIRDLDTCSQLALKQPLPNTQLVLMMDASFTSHLCEKIVCSTSMRMEDRYTLTAEEGRLRQSIPSYLLPLLKKSDIFSGGRPSRSLSSRTKNR